MNVAVVGVGAISKMHLAAIRECGQNITALCDILPEKCYAAKERFGLRCNVYDDYLQMLQSERLDIVHICTPHYLHAEMICAALARHIHVLCEKPLAINEEQLRKIEERVRHTSAQLGVCHQTRYNEAVRYAKQLFADDPITAGAGTLVWQRDVAYYRSAPWRGKRETEGGGVMINQALHTLDLLQWFCGMPQSVTAHISNDTLKDAIDVEESAFGIFSLPNGGNFIINATNAAKYSFPINLMFRSEKHTACIMGDNLFLDGKIITKSDGLPLFGKEVWGTGHVKLIRDFYDCIQNGRKFELDFYEGQKAVRLILKMYDAHGERIAV